MQPSIGGGGQEEQKLGGCRDQDSLGSLSSQMTGASLAVSLGGQTPPSQAYRLFCVHPRCHPQCWWPSRVSGRTMTRTHSSDLKLREKQVSLVDLGLPL